MTDTQMDSLYRTFLDEYINPGLPQRFVPGCGSIMTDVMIVGEAPGQREDELGRPFAGPAGRILDTLLQKHLKVPRENVYTTNVYKFRNNKTMTIPASVTRTAHELLGKEISLINPKVLILCGKTAANAVYPGKHFPAIVGKTARIKRTMILFTRHPSAGLYNAELMPLLEQDFQLARQMLEQEEDFETTYLLG